MVPTPRVDRDEEDRRRLRAPARDERRQEKTERAPQGQVVLTRSVVGTPPVARNPYVPLPHALVPRIRYQNPVPVEGTSVSVAGLGEAPRHVSSPPPGPTGSPLRSPRRTSEPVEPKAALQLTVAVVPARLTATPLTLPICIIDDDPSIRRSIERLLVLNGFRVRTFASAEAFLAEGPDVVAGCLILDLQLPGVSGLELRKQMTSSGRAIPVIAMSGSTDERLESEAIALGAHAFLRKPFQAEALLAEVLRVLRSQPQ